MVIVSGGFAPPPPDRLSISALGPVGTKRTLDHWSLYLYNPNGHSGPDLVLLLQKILNFKRIVRLKSHVTSYQSTAKFSPWLQTIFSARAYTDNVWIFTCLPVECWQQYWSDHSIMIARPRTLQPFSKPFKKRGFFF